MHAGIPPPGSRHPPRADTPPGADITPGADTPPGADTHTPPGTRHPQDQIPPPPRSRPPRSRHHPGSRPPTGPYTPPEADSSIRSMIGRYCILLECILVTILFSPFCCRYLELVHPIWHKTNFKIKWIYISFVINWQFGPILIAAHHVPTTKVGEIYLCYFFKFT